MGNLAEQIEIQPILLKPPLSVEEFIKKYGDLEDMMTYELIDGYVYMSFAPARVHQSLAVFLTSKIGVFLEGKTYQLYVAPFNVFLSPPLSENEKDGKQENKKNKSGKIREMYKKGTVVQPDLFVVCETGKLRDDGCHGAPDFIIEIASPTTGDSDFMRKFFKYLESGVKEYWIVNPDEDIKKIMVFKFNPETKKPEKFEIFTFSDKIKISVLDELEIDFSQFNFYLG